MAKYLQLYTATRLYMTVMYKLCVHVSVKFKFKFNEISSEAGQMASIPGYTIVSRNTFQYTMI